jgi:cyclopropane fatty-acyl-phospholipid synthase-like methyltransferase
MNDRLAYIRRVYARQEYLTPGAAETVERILEVARPEPSNMLLDVACGKLEAACTIAGRSGCQVVSVDLYPLFFDGVRAKVDARGLHGRVTLVHADGKRLPVPDGAFDAAYCIGAPSIVGLKPCLAELSRAVRAGGAVVVSDIIWREKPGALGLEWRWVAEMQQIAKDEYAALLTEAGLALCDVTVFPKEAWDAYYAPMLEVAREARNAGDAGFADLVEDNNAMEQSAVAAWLDYAMFVARKR